MRACADPHIESALTAWKQSHSKSPPSLPESSHQQVWDAPLIAATITSLLDGAPSQQATARLLAVTTPESGTWLNALPISSLGLRMDADVMRIAAGLRLGVANCHPHRCCSCGADVDSLGTHGLSCRSSSGRHCRHAAVNDIVKSLDSARIPSHLEPSGLYRSDGRRPDGGSIYCTVEGREGFSVGCNMPRHSGPILPFNCNSRSRSGGQGSRASKAGEVFSSRRLPLFRTHCN